MRLLLLREFLRDTYSGQGATLYSRYSSSPQLGLADVLNSIFCSADDSASGLWSLRFFLPGDEDGLESLREELEDYLAKTEIRRAMEVVEGPTAEEGLCVVSCV